MSWARAPRMMAPRDVDPPLTLFPLPMSTPVVPGWRQRLTRLILGLAALVALLLPLGPARAAALTAETTPAPRSFQQELESLQGQQGIFTVPQARRLADLSRLDTAIGTSTDRPTVENNTSHNLGVFVRSKRQSAAQPATFVVLGAGNETDDDFESVALFIPANVPVSWPGKPAEKGATPARVARLLPGQELRVSDPVDTTGYQLNLPAFALDTESADLGALPSLSQEDLDAQPENVPVD